MSTDHGNMHPGQAKQAAKTTIVGGQPPGNQRLLSEIPVGLEQLLAMAAASEEFAAILRNEPERALKASGLQLTDTERAVLHAIPGPMLDTMIGRVETALPQPERRAFLERAGAALALLLGAGALAACKDSGGTAQGGAADPMGGKPADMARPTDTMKPDAMAPEAMKPEAMRPKPMTPETMQREPPRIQAGATIKKPVSPRAGARAKRPMVPSKRPRGMKATKNPRSTISGINSRAPTGIRPGRGDDD